MMDDNELARELLAEEYENQASGQEGPYPSYANLARSGSGAFTLCSIRAIERALQIGRGKTHLTDTRSAPDG